MDEEYKRMLGQVLARKRREAGLGKQQLALMVGVNRLTIRKIENGVANPTVGILLRITRGLGASLADVLVECERSLMDDPAPRSPILPPVELVTGAPETRYYLTRF